MPHINIEMFKGRSNEEKMAIMQAVYDGLFEALKVPERHCYIKIIEFDKDNFLNSANKPEQYLTIEIRLFSGRSLAVKRQLYQTVTQQLNKININMTDLFIVLQEIPMENWGIRGGIPASEIKFDYKVNI